MTNAMELSSPPANGMARISQRAPKSCQRCSIKKMKCSKEIPCLPCLDSGIGDQCRREQVITTKHIRQTQRKNRREILSRSGEGSPVKPDLRDDAERRSFQPVQDQGPPFPGVRPRPGVMDSSYSESHRYAYRHEVYGPPGSGSEKAVQAAPSAYYPSSTSTITDPETSTYNEQADIENAANSLELLAWGRQRDSGLSPSSAMVVNAASRSADILLPRQARLVLCYHRDWMSWTHNTIHWPTFFSECQDYWLEGIVVEKAWLSIYYAALCAALIVMPSQQRIEIGIADGITKHLYHNSIEALKSADYAANHTRRCVQAVCLITPCAHVFGGSNLFAVLMSSAIRIAQSLNMHRIGPDLRSPTTIELRRDREIQKSMWAYLCTQDWFNIPFANAHAIAPNHCTTPLPLNCDGIGGVVPNGAEFQALSMETPTQMTYILNLYQVADICRSFFDKTAALSTDSCDDQTLRILFEHVLTADAQLKTVSKTCTPYLRSKLGENASSTALMSIQRTTFIISTQNKVLSIHRRFFLRSLADRWYTYTRVACLTAAKTILEEYQSPSCHQMARNVWQVVAHVIGACVVLLLAMMFSDEDHNDREMMRKLICNCVELLTSSSNVTDMLQRGIKLIGIMLQQESEIQSGQRERFVNIGQIASELQEPGPPGVQTYNDNFMEMAGALDLDMLLQPFGATYAPFFNQADEYV